MKQSTSSRERVWTTRIIANPARGHQLSCLETVISLKKIRTSTIRRYFQHAHFIPIVGVGKRGEY